MVERNAGIRQIENPAQVPQLGKAQLRNNSHEEVKKSEYGDKVRRDE
jgi:hypothetical protein